MIQPPRLPRKLLEWYCQSGIIEDLLGDMDELFFRTARTSLGEAKRRYWRQAISLLFSYALRRRRSPFRPGSHIDIFRNYSKVAYRSLVRDKLFTTINIIGLSVGMSIGLLALAAFVDFYEVDRFHEKGDRIFRVVTHVDDYDQLKTYANSSLPVAETLLRTAGAIDEVVRVSSVFQPQIRTGNTFIPLAGYYADRNFFKVFSFNFLSGNEETCLDNPNSIVLTSSAARKLFNKSDPVGQTVEVDGLGTFTVTGLIDDYGRSHFYFEALASISTLENAANSGQMTNWGPITNHYTYVLFPDGASHQSTERLLKDIHKEEFEKSNLKVEYELQSLFDIPKTDYYNEIGLAWGMLAMIVFFFLSFLILIPACLNYSSISISRALKRSKEIGLRKVVGGRKRQIFIQFLVETVFVSITSLLAALYIFTLVRAEFKQMIVQGSRTFDLELTLPTLLAFIGFGLFTGLLAGIFPAMYFARLNPVETLRNTFNTRKLGKVNLRKTLIVVQFSISLVFILGVSIILKQYHYALNFDFGFDKENILDVQLRGINLDRFEAAFSQVPEVEQISMSSEIPGSWSVDGTFASLPDSEDSLFVSQIHVNHKYIANLGLELMAGSNFPPDPGEHERFVIVNEEFLRNFGFQSPSEAIGKSISVDQQDLSIRGVVKDFNHESIREKISSFFFRNNPDHFAYANLRLHSDNLLETIDKLESTWNRVSEDRKFEARFLNDEVQDVLISFTNMVKIFGFMGILAVTISCLGLLAMVVFSTESRLKELGVRKVLGASSLSLAVSMSKDYFKLIVVAIVIAIPIAYLFFDRIFLQIHHYRDNIGLLEIISGVSIILIVAMLTIWIQAFKAAKSNPVVNLRYE